VLRAITANLRATVCRACGNQRLGERKRRKPERSNGSAGCPGAGIGQTLRPSAGGPEGVRCLGGRCRAGHGAIMAPICNAVQRRRPFSSIHGPVLHWDTERTSWRAARLLKGHRAATLSRMKLLALDASADTLSIAVGVDDAVWAREMPAGPAASSGALGTVQELLEAASLRLLDLDAIAFGQGPGAFTGLRTACAVVQGLAFGSGKPVLAINTLQAVAQRLWAHWATQLGSLRSHVLTQDGLPALEVVVAMDARMGEAYAQRFRLPLCAYSMAQAQPVGSPQVLGLRELNASWAENPPQVLLGSALSVWGDGLEAVGALRVWPPAQSSIPEADAPGVAPGLPVLAEAMLPLACAQWQQGQGLDVGLASPLYVRDRVAQTIEERLALKRAGALAP
jgi:tRNA threonylcarbamoyladenosine biosynthesis protein TsaB